MQQFDGAIEALVESPGELARLERIAAVVGRRQPVLLRAALETGADHRPWIEAWGEDEEGFRAEREAVLLYR